MNKKNQLKNNLMKEGINVDTFKQCEELNSKLLEKVVAGMDSQLCHKNGRDHDRQHSRTDSGIGRGPLHVRHSKCLH